LETVDILGRGRTDSGLMTVASERDTGQAIGVDRGVAHATRRGSWWIPAALTISVMAIVTVAYWPVLSVRAFYFDDHEYLHDNPLVQRPSWASTARFLGELFEPSTVKGYYQPLTMISLMLDYRLGGRVDDPRAFRRTNLALHVVNTALVIVLLVGLFGWPWPAALAGLLFGLHPTAVESVAWLAQRKNLLSMTFGLLCLLGYVRFARRGGRWAYGVCTISFVLALLAKPMVVPLPVLMLLLDVWPLRRWNRGTWHRLLIEKVPWLVIAAAFAAVTIVSQYRTAGLGQPRPILQNLLICCHNIVFYLGKLAWPANLCVFYPFPERLDLSQPSLRIGLIGTLVLAVVLLVSWRWTRALVTGWLFFFVAILPTLGFVGFTIVIAADRFVYLPMIGLLLPLAAAVTWLWTRPGRARPTIRAALGVVLCGVAAAYAVGVRTQLRNWQDDVTLYRTVLARSDRVWQAHTNLANALLDRGQIVEAIKHYRKAVQLEADRATSHYNLGRALVQQGRYEQAVEELQEAIRLDPQHAEAHGQLGVALFRLGRVDQAEQVCRRAVQLAPDNAEIVFNLGVLEAKRRRYNKAIDWFQQAVALEPDYAEAHYNLAAVFLEQDRPRQAIEHYRKALALAGAKSTTRGLASRACRGLARALARAGRYREAVAALRDRLASNPGDARIACELAWLLASCPDETVRDGSAAVALAERVCKVTDFGSIRALDVLAAAYAEAGRFDQAVQTARRARKLARSAGKAALADQIALRLQRYASGKPFRLGQDRHED